MLSHVSVGVSDLERSAVFYDAALATLGYGRVFEIAGIAIAYGEKFPNFWISPPLDASRPASAGNGTHIAFVAGSHEAVDAFHASALDHGARDAGAPGPRPDYGPDYYGAFVRDPDGNKIEACFHQSS